MTFTQADVSGTQICHNITILDDSIVESSERFAVELTNPIRLRVLQPNPVTYTLQPNVNDIDSKFVVKYNLTKFQRLPLLPVSFFALCVGVIEALVCS